MMGLGHIVVATGYAHLDAAGNDNAVLRGFFPHIRLHGVSQTDLATLARCGVLRVDAHGYALTHLGRILLSR